MVRHIILWKLNEDLSDDQKQITKLRIKDGLEGLYGRIDGLSKIQVRTEGLPSSSADLMLDCTFDGAQALEAYQKNPLHIAVAEGAVRPNVSQRLCLDFEE